MKTLWALDNIEKTFSENSSEMLNFVFSKGAKQI
jgi:hypothetical protein